MAGVQLELDGAVALLTIEHREVRNALTPEMCVELTAACEAIDARDDVGAAVIRGADGTFCSGADTRRWGAHVDWAGAGTDMVQTIYEGFARVGRLAVPTVAAVRGAAVGAGLNLMLACDLRIVGDDARLVAGFTRVGIHPGGGFFTLLARVAGWETTAAMGLFGEALDGAEAVARGLAWAAVPDAEVEARALALARAASGDPELARRVVRTMRQEVGPPAIGWEAARDLERGLQVWSLHRRFGAGA